MRTFETVPWTCPSCGDVGDRASSLDATRGPRPGDLGICGTCGLITVYEAGGGRHVATEPELRAFPDPGRLRVHRAVVAFAGRPRG